MSYPTKAEREVCWGARDKYWECLDKIGVKEASKEGPCQEFRKFYESSCSALWVKHFDRKRSYLQFKDQIEKEGIPNKICDDQRVWKKRRVYSEIAN